MIILLIRRIPGKQNNNKDLSDPYTMAVHNEAMKKFREVHPNINVLTAGDILTPGGDLLAPVIGVNLPRNICN